MYHVQTPEHSYRKFEKLLFPEYKKIYHINGNTLDNRKNNLNKVTEKTNYNIKDDIKQEIKEEIKQEIKIIYDWTGGIIAGSIGFRNNTYLVRFTEKQKITASKSFKIIDNNIEDALILAEEYREQISLEKGLTRNQYRLVETQKDGRYIEMKLQDNYICKFNEEDLHLAIKHNCHAHSNHNRYYMYQTISRNEKCIFHRILFPEWKIIDHINRDGLDNRRKNLRSVSVSENNLNQHMRKDCSSGKTGIH